MTEFTCTIGVGSNSNDKEEQLKWAIRELEKYLNHVQVSNLYESPAQNGHDPDYMNAVLHGYTIYSAEDVKKHLKDLERIAGRNDELKKRGIVPLDLDLIIYDNRILRPGDFQKQYFNIGYRQLLTQGAFESV